MADIPSPRCLSLKTALQLFDIKVAPVASYGIQVVWHRLTTPQLESLEKVKPTFLKRVMGLPKNAKNRLVYLLANTKPLIEDLVRRFRLPLTPQLAEFRLRYAAKHREVDMCFYDTRAMTDHSWKKPNPPQRHLICRYAVHGFHHKLCRRSDFHEPNANCTCRLCNSPCGRYHFGECPRVGSLSSLAE
jgi:hypothetical protein